MLSLNLERPVKRSEHRLTCARALPLVGLLFGLAGAYVAAGDDIPFESDRRDGRLPWINIHEASLHMLAASRGPRPDFEDRPVYLMPDDRGYSELVRMMQVHASQPDPDKWTAVFGAERGMIFDFDEGYREGALYFGVITAPPSAIGGPLSNLSEDDVHILGRMELLRFWATQYRTTRHVILGVILIAVGMMFQAVAVFRAV